MKKVQRIAIPLLIALLLLALAVAQAGRPAEARPTAATTSFHFVMAADSRDGYTVLATLSRKMATLNPVFGFFPGDLCGSFDVTCINNTWKPAMDGNNNDGMLAKTFVSRGNHDNGTLSTWQGLWDFSAMATRVGATHFTAPTSDATYSFDYGNSHFAVIDLPQGGSSTWTSSEISWLDSDLTAAENRGIVHEFLFSHGPMYSVTTEHGSGHPSAALIAVLNKHRISAGFHGHEHITAYAHVTTSREPGINSYEQFTMGRAGAPAYSVSEPVDWHADQNAFADVAVSGNNFTVTVYSESGSAIFSKTFTDGTTSGPTPTPSASTSTATYISTASYDGQILESTETSTVGGTINATGATFRLGDDASNRQYRSILSFNTAGLPDNAVISSVTLKIKQAGAGGSNPFNSMGNIMADVMTGAFSGSTTLQAGDFQATASQNAVMSIPNTPVSRFYTKTLSATYFSFINKTGVTQFRLRFATDDNNNLIADYLNFYSGNYSTNASYRPKLIVNYTVP